MEKLTYISAQVTKSFERQVRVVAAQRGQSKSELMRMALRDFIGRLPAEPRPPQVTVSAQAGDGAAGGE